MPTFIETHITRPITEAFKARQKLAERVLRQSKATGYPWVDRITHDLLPFQTLTDVQKMILCNEDGTYDRQLIATAAIAARYADNKKEYERILGMYGDGYRSDFHYNITVVRWRDQIHPRHGDKVRKNDLRREIRRLYYYMRSMSLETIILNP